MSCPFGKVALCLSGGGARGIYQFGMIKAFRDLGLDYDMLYGSSVGALNGALLHQNEMDKMEELWLSIRSNDIYRIWPWTFINAFTSKSSIASIKPLTRLIEKYVNYDKLLANLKDFIVNATDMTHWQTLSIKVRDLTREELPSYIKASVNVPVMFEPVKFRGMNLVDAGILNNFSIGQAIRDGADTMIIMTPTTPDPKPSKNLLDTLLATLTVTEFGQLYLGISCLDKINKIIDKVNEDLEPDFRKIRKIIIQPEKPLGIDLLDFNYKQDRKKLIQDGYNLAKTILEKELAQCDQP